MGRKELKYQVFDILISNEWQARLDEFIEFPGRKIINPLIACFYHENEAIKWRAITAMGIVVSNLANHDMESARVVMRRLMWTLNEESGGIGWGAAESMGDIMANHLGLANEFASILISYAIQKGNFLEFVPIQSGVLWGIMRLAQVYPLLAKDIVEHIPFFFDSPVPTIKALSILCLQFIKAGQENFKIDSVTNAQIVTNDQIKLLSNDLTKVRIFLDRQFQTFGIGQLAQDLFN